MFKSKVKAIEELKEEFIKLKESFEQKESENQYAILEVVELSKLSDDEVYEKYRYKTWDQIPKLVSKYISNRFNIKFWYGPLTPLGGVWASVSEAIGIALDLRKKLNNLATPPNEVDENLSKN